MMIKYNINQGNTSLYYKTYILEILNKYIKWYKEHKCHFKLTVEMIHPYTVGILQGHYIRNIISDINEFKYKNIT